MNRLGMAAAILVAAWAGGSAARTQPYQPPVGPHTLNPGDWPAHYPFADETESAVAASEVHHVRYIDSHIRLVEVAYFPGVRGKMHGHPYPSVFAIDAPVPKATNTPFDPARNMQSVLSAPVESGAWPICRAASPQGLHHETNLDTYPHHFYRLEFLRLDGPALHDRWRQWYPWALQAAGGSRMLYEDDHVRLVEVLIAPGATQGRQANRYPAVLAFDAAEGPVLDGGAAGHESPVLKGFESLRCATTGPRVRSPGRNTGRAPIHYYRIEFKRIDGDGIKDHWREWYPWMATLKDAYDRSPYVVNY